MESSIQLKRVSDDRFNIDHCIICQDCKTENLVSEAKGRSKLMEVASEKKDIVWEGMQLATDQHFKYHMNNKCYKASTHEKSRQRVQVSLFDFIISFLH